MNKRIKELIEQSGMGIDQYGLVYALRDTEHSIDLDEFINRLINECAISAENHSRSYSGGDASSICQGAAAAVRSVGRNDE